MDEAVEGCERADGVFSGKRLVSQSHLASLCAEIHTQAPGPSCPWPRKKRGLHGITQYGKRFVRSAAAMLQRKVGRQRLSFLTLTLPEFEPSQARQIAESWGKVVNRFLQWLGRRLTRSRLPKQVVSVTELQPKRLESGSQSVLHLHLLFQGRHGVRGRWELSPVEVRRAWLKILGNVLGTEVNSTACEELKMVKSSAEGYLGKYMSKGKDDVSKFVAVGAESYVPGQWWNCTKEMRQWVRENISRGPATGALLECVVEAALDEGCKEVGVFMRPIILDLDGGPWLAAWVGRVNREAWEDLTDMLKSRLIEIHGA